MGALVEQWIDHDWWSNQHGIIWEKDGLYYGITHGYRSGKIYIWISEKLYHTRGSGESPYTVTPSVLAIQSIPGHRKDFYKLIKDPLRAFASLIL